MYLKLQLLFASVVCFVLSATAAVDKSGTRRLSRRRRVNTIVVRKTISKEHIGLNSLLSQDDVESRGLQVDTPSIGPSDIPSFSSKVPSDVPSVLGSKTPSDVPSIATISDAPSGAAPTPVCEADKVDFFSSNVTTPFGSFEIAVEKGCVFSLRTLDPTECDLEENPDSYESFDRPSPWLNLIALKVYGGEVLNNSAVFTGEAVPSADDVTATVTRRFIIFRTFGAQVAGTSSALNGLPYIWETFLDRDMSEGFVSTLQQVITDAPEVFLTNDNTTCGFPACI